MDMGGPNPCGRLGGGRGEGAGTILSKLPCRCSSPFMPELSTRDSCTAGVKGVSTAPATCPTHRGRHVVGMQLQIDCSRYHSQVKPPPAPGQLHEKAAILETYVCVAL